MLCSCCSIFKIIAYLRAPSLSMLPQPRGNIDIQHSFSHSMLGINILSAICCWENVSSAASIFLDRITAIVLTQIRCIHFIIAKRTSALKQPELHLKFRLFPYNAINYLMCHSSKLFSRTDAKT